MDGLATIFAVSSGRLPSGVAIIRISGADAFAALTALGIDAVLAVRHLHTARLRLDDGFSDVCMVARFEAPSSFTGENVVELHVHGSRALVDGIFRRLRSLPRYLPANAGEFTRRAFINGKVSLTEAEGLSDLLAAETATQLRLAHQASSKRLDGEYARLRADLTHARALVESALDFSDEGDVASDSSVAAWLLVTQILARIEAQLALTGAAEIVRSGFRVAIVGRPNAGKSSLLNALAGRDVAIVSNEPGTTRDVIEVALDLGDQKVVLSDTAGVRSDAGVVESEGIRRTHRAVGQANHVLVLRAVDDEQDWLAVQHSSVSWLWTKTDLGSMAVGLGVSVETGAGLVPLLDMLRIRAADAVGSLADTIPNSIRQQTELATAAHHLRRAFAEIELDQRAEELRLASVALARLVGAIGVEDVLGAIFSTFCIGK